MVVEFFLLVSFGVLWFFLAAPDQAEPARRHTLEHAGAEREFFVGGAEGARPQEGPLPLVFFIHGGTGSASTFMNRNPEGFLNMSRREGFIAVFPTGYPDEPGSKKHHWNDGRFDSAWTAHAVGSDDVGFFARMVERLKNEYPVDASRVYAIGASNGGMMAQRLALEMPETFAAVGSVIANLPLELALMGLPRAKRQVSIMMINGDKDPIMPYQGGNVQGFRGRRLGEILSAEQTFRFWLYRNGCLEPGRAAALPRETFPEHERLGVRSATGADGSSQVVFCTVKGGGHVWPGRRISAEHEAMVGESVMGIDTNQRLWDFVKRHTAARA